MKISNIAFIIAGIFALFGGFLTNIVPPVHNKTVAFGSIEMTCLIGGLLILNMKASRDPQKLKTLSYILGIAAITALISYYLVYTNFVIELHPGTTIVKGSEPTEIVKDYCKYEALDFKTCEKIYLRKAYDLKTLPEQIWTFDSIIFNERLILVLYSLLTVLVCSFMFIVTEPKDQTTLVPSASSDQPEAD